MATVPHEQLEQSLAEASGNIAGYFQLFGFEEWSKHLPAETDFFVGLGLGLVAVVYIAWIISHRRYRADLKAVTLNPGNGWRVSRLIMRVWTLRRVETLCRDFLAQPHKTDEILVLAARSIRQHRSKGGTTDASWKFWGDLQEAMEQHGADPIGTAISDLDAEFPPSWLTRCWMMYRQRREKTQPKEPKTHVLRPSFSGTAQGKLTASLEYNPAPAPPWRKPLRRLYWIWRKRIRKLIQRSAG